MRSICSKQGSWLARHLCFLCHAYDDSTFLCADGNEVAVNEIITK